MATVSATITVTFTSQYVGLHRICYRINNSGTYTCATVSCAGNGAECSYDIPVLVDNETCEDVVFDGYAQSACRDIDSEDGRIPFLSTFTPSPACKKYTMICLSAGVASAVVTNPGSKYSFTPSVVVTGDGTGATAVAVMGTGMFVGAILIFQAGTGYTDGSYVNVPLLGGNGSGATADIVVSGGSIVSAVINNPGSGYDIGNDTTNPDPSAMGPSTPTVTAILVCDTDNGEVLAVNITNSGSGYTTTPTITIAPGAGITATADAVLAYCDSFTSAGCDGLTPVNYTNVLHPGDTIEVCSLTIFPIPASFDSAINGNCLCECTNYTIEPTGTGAVYTYIYTECNGEAVTGTIAQTDSPSFISFCAVTGSLVYRLDSGVAGINVTTGDC